MTATAMATENWRETCLLTIYDGTNKQNFALITESFDFKPGDKDIDSVPLVNGGRITKFTPEGPYEFSAKIIPVGAGDALQASAEGFWNRMHVQTTPDNTNPLYALNNRVRTLYSVSIIMTSGTYPADAMAASPSTSDAQRISFRNAYITSNTFSFSPTDGWVGDITIKGSAFTKAGNSNVLYESTDATGSVIPALSWS